MSGPTPHLPADALLDYWLGDADAAATDAVDEHLMACDACGAALDELIALGDAVRGALRDGAVAVVTGAAFVQRLADRGSRLREYRVAGGGSVNCTVAPDDDVLVTRLLAPLQGVQRVDLRLQPDEGAEAVLHDVPFDAAAGEVVLINKVAAIRQQGPHTLRITLVDAAAASPRELARYTFRHRPWPG